MIDTPQKRAETRATSTNSRIPYHLHEVLGKLSMPMKYVISTLIARAQDPEAEGPPVSEVLTPPQTPVWGWLPFLTLTCALGLLSVAYGYTSLRFGETAMEMLFWLGILLIFVPPAVRLILPATSRFERISLVCVVGVCLYLVFVINNPLSLSPYDAFLHWRTADDIASSQHLFTENTLLPSSPFYPGLEIATNALSTVSELTIHQAGILVICVARLIMILSLFLLSEQLTKSARIAGIATILYMANPHFLFFDADFIYESLALPIATFMLFVIARQATLNDHRRQFLLIAWIVLSAVVVTHHVTDYFFDGFLILWTVICLFQYPAPSYRSNLIMITLFGVCASLAWATFQGNPVVDYLSSYLGRALQELNQILTGASHARQLFADYSGRQPTPLWGRLVTISSVLLIFSGIPLGLLCLWQRYRRNALAWMLGAASLLYPISQVFRFTNFGSDVTDRAAAFLFIPISCILAIYIVQFWPARSLSHMRVTLLTCAISILFLGGVISPSWQLLPGPYLVAADPRSLEPQGIQAALWAGSYLGPKNHIAADRINGLLLNTYGDQRIQSTLANDKDVTQIFFSPEFDFNDPSLLRRAKVRFLVVDQRFTTAPPTIGFYFEPGEPDSFQRRMPLSREALAKFNTVPQISRIFDNGSILFYDVGEFTHAPEIH